MVSNSVRHIEHEFLISLSAQKQCERASPDAEKYNLNEKSEYEIGIRMNLDVLSRRVNFHTGMEDYLFHRLEGFHTGFIFVNSFK